MVNDPAGTVTNRAARGLGPQRPLVDVAPTTPSGVEGEPTGSREGPQHALTLLIMVVATSSGITRTG
jgi:hypothetical protein